EKKIDRGVLLELVAIADGVRGIEQHPDAERQIGLPGKATDFPHLAVVEDLKIGFVKVGHELVTVVQHGKEDIDKGDDLSDLALIGILGRSGRSGLLRVVAEWIERQHSQTHNGKKPSAHEQQL